MPRARPSFATAAEVVTGNPWVKRAALALGALASLAFTTGIWPVFQGWAVTRASKDAVALVDARVSALERALSVDSTRLGTAESDDTAGLSQGERIEWASIRIKRLEMQLYLETRASVGLEARLRMPRPDSVAAQRVAAAARGRFDDAVRSGDSLGTARAKALEAVFSPEDP